MENPYIEKNGEIKKITKAGYEFLDNIVTDTRGLIYAFRKEADPLKVAMAMARLSRRGDDLRKIYLEEFVEIDPYRNSCVKKFLTWLFKKYTPTENNENAAKIAKRIVTGFGDDSVAQLAFVSLIVEDASNLLTKILEWPRLTAYLEQSTRYIFFDQVDELGNYKFYTPLNLPNDLLKLYKKSMNEIFGLYSEIIRGLTEFFRKEISEPKDNAERAAWLAATRAQACDAARNMLPVATKSTVGIVASAQSLQSIIYHLLESNLIESQHTGNGILREARKVIPQFLERVDIPQYGGYEIIFRKEKQSAIKKMADLYVPATYKNSDEVVLFDYWPKDELDLVLEMLFSEAKTRLYDIIISVGKLTQKQKIEIFEKYMSKRMNRRNKPGRAIEKAHYEWQITADYGTFRDIQRHRIVDAMEWQKLTPNYGYNVPPKVIEAGFEEKFHQCFSTSENLYKKMFETGFEEEAQYATLLGHRMRYRFITNAREAFHLIELRSGPQGHPGYRKIAIEMHRKISEVHPNMARAMKFVNKGENQELTRMAAELATQKKLTLLQK